MEIKSKPQHSKPQLSEIFFKVAGVPDDLGEAFPAQQNWFVLWDDTLVKVNGFDVDLLPDSKPIAFVASFISEPPKDSQLFPELLRFLDRKKSMIQQVGYWDTQGYGRSNIFKFVDLPFGETKKKYYDDTSLAMLIHAFRTWHNDPNRELPTLISAADEEQFKLYLSHPIPISQPDGVGLIKYARTKNLRVKLIDFVELGGKPLNSNGLYEIQIDFLPEKSIDDHADYVLARFKKLMRANRLEYKLIEIEFYTETLPVQN